MKEHESSECISSQKERRKFLQGAAAVAGGLVLGLQSARAQENEGGENPPAAAPLPETLLNLPEPVLAEVGGFEVVENGDDKIIVARTGPTSIVACSAICTHKGGTMVYDHETGQLICPNHGARFHTTGKVAKGPAKRDLKSYKTRAILGLSSDATDAEQGA